MCINFRTAEQGGGQMGRKGREGGSAYRTALFRAEKVMEILADNESSSMSHPQNGAYHWGLYHIHNFVKCPPEK